MTSSVAGDRKKQVVIGELPADFLRFDDRNHEPNCSQVELDEQAARNLHNQLNVQQDGGGEAGTGYYAGGGFVPPNSKGRLSVCLVQARLTKNYGFVKMDPYCRVRVGNTVFETPTDAGGGKNPHWNRTVYCYLPQGIDSIFLEIFDERAFSTDERIAWNNITIPTAVFNGDTIDDWYSLSGQQGDAKEGMINIVFTLYPVTAPHVAYIPVSPTNLPQAVYVSGGAMPPGVIPYQTAGIQPAAQPQQHEQNVTPTPEAGPLYTDDDVKELQEMFSNMDVEVIKSVMYEKRGNKDAAINALLSIGSDIQTN